MVEFKNAGSSRGRMVIKSYLNLTLLKALSSAGLI